MLLVDSGSNASCSREGCDVTCDTGEVTCRTGEEPCDRGEEPCDRGEEPCDRGEEPCDRGEELCNRSEVTCDTGEVTRDTGEVTCDRGEEPCDRGEEPCDSVEETCDTREETCDRGEVTCNRRGRRATYITSAHNMLPPCEVCGEPSSGIHYGANTCEGCKGFFRRYHLRIGHVFKCQTSLGRCDVEAGSSRWKCQYCRYKKCLRVGMSIQAIKIGRYSKEVKALNYMNAKRARYLHHQRVRRYVLTPPSYPAHENLGAAVSPHHRRAERGDDINMEAEEEQPSNRLLRQPCDLTLSYMLLQAHRNTSPYVDAKIDGVLKMQERDMLTFYPEPLPPGAAIPYYPRELSWPHAVHLLLPAVESVTRNAHAFSGAVPNFCRLSSCAQMSLLRGFLYSSYMVTSSRCFNATYLVNTVSTGVSVQANPAHPRPLYRAQMWQHSFAGRFNKLRFRDPEVAMARAIVLITPPTSSRQSSPESCNSGCTEGCSIGCSCSDRVLLQDMRHLLVRTLRMLLSLEDPSRGEQRFELFMEMLHELEHMAPSVREVFYQEAG